MSNWDGKGSQHTPPVPESCIWEKPVTAVESIAKPPWLSRSVSATALAIPEIGQLNEIARSNSQLPYGRVAPANTCPRYELVNSVYETTFVELTYLHWHFQSED